MRGQDLIEACKKHVLQVMREMPECQPLGAGARTGQITERAELAMDLEHHKGYFTYCIVQLLIKEGAVRVVGKGNASRYLLAEVSH